MVVKKWFDNVPLIWKTCSVDLQVQGGRVGLVAQSQDPPEGDIGCAHLYYSDINGVSYIYLHSVHVQVRV